MVSMPPLQDMPQVVVTTEQLQPFGAQWALNGQALSRTPPNSSSQLGNLFDAAVGHALGAMLGGIQVTEPLSATSLIPPAADCVEVGPVRVIGGVRAQNFDVGYRPDGIRFAYDTKTLNDEKSVGKNYQNMINDLATEATTVHLRFPFAVVAFMVIVPMPCLSEAKKRALVGTLERLARRENIDDPPHMAEAIAMVAWNPADGSIDGTCPPAGSPLRIENFSPRVQVAYFDRYFGLAPHNT